MTNRITIVLAILVGLFFLVDQVGYAGGLGLLLARKFIVFVDWLEFWR